MAHTVNFINNVGAGTPGGVINDSSLLRLKLLDSSYNIIQELSIGQTSTTVGANWTYSRLTHPNGQHIDSLLITNTTDPGWGPNLNGTTTNYLGGSARHTFGSEPDSVWNIEATSISDADIVTYEVDPSYGGIFNTNRFALVTMQTIPDDNIPLSPLFHQTLSNHVHEFVKVAPARMKSLYFRMIGPNATDFRIKKIKIENLALGTSVIKTITSGWHSDGSSYVLTESASFWGTSRNNWRFTLLEVEAKPATVSPRDICDESFQSGKFWDLKKSYFDETVNSPGGFYNNFEQFSSGIRTDSTLKNFTYESPFNYIPSYGSSVDISFDNDIIEYGESYSSFDPVYLNNIRFSMNLNFTDKSDEQASGISTYIENAGSHGKFPYQIKDRIGLTNQEAYKSLYSVPPYFVQDFRCESLNVDKKFKDNNDVSMFLVNENLSIFSMKNILEMPCMPESQRQIISGARSADSLGIKPSHSLPITTNLKSQRFASRNSRNFTESDGINSSANSYDLTYNNLNNEELLEVLNFYIYRMGAKKFNFKITEPYVREGSFLCRGVNHNYVFKNNHTVRVKILEVF